MNSNWRWESPGAVSGDIVTRFRQFIDRMGWEGSRQSLFEHFKRQFATATGSPHYTSSSESWASSDLDSLMYQAAENGPVFIEAFCAACENLKAAYPRSEVPPLSVISRVLADENADYQIRDDEIIRAGAQAIDIPVVPPSLEDQARAAIATSLATSDRALAEGNGRQAVQELLWLLESIATAFRGMETSGGTIQGSYFNQIVRELKSLQRTKHQEQIFEWIRTLHGYLSAPAGGGVRHGLDLKRGVALELNEARLCCNLIRSYIAYLIAEHERLSADG